LIPKPIIPITSTTVTQSLLRMASAGNNIIKCSKSY
jgi:hypothetical protein